MVLVSLQNLTRIKKGKKSDDTKKTVSKSSKSYLVGILQMLSERVAFITIYLTHLSPVSPVDIDHF